MEFSLSQEQSVLRDSVRKFCKEKYSREQRHLVARDDQGFRRAHWLQFAELGWLGAAVPEDAGGFGGSAIECALIAEEFGRALVLEPYISCAVAPAQAIRASLPITACREQLDSLISGQQVFALAHSETSDGGERSFVETRAQRTSSGDFILNGRKAPVLAGSHANRLVVSVRTAGEPDDPNGLSLLLVDSNLPGILARPFRLLDGTAATEFQFNDVIVPASALLGAEGAAAEPIAAATAFI